MINEKTYGTCKRENIPYFRITYKAKNYSKIEFDLNTITTRDNLFQATRKYWSLNFEVIFKDYIENDLIRTKDMVRNGTFKAFSCKSECIEEIYNKFMALTTIFINRYLEADETKRAKYNMPLTKRSTIKRQRVKRIKPRCGVLTNKDKAVFSGRGVNVR